MVMPGDAVDSAGQQTPADLGVGASLRVVKSRLAHGSSLWFRQSHTALCATVDSSSSRGRAFVIRKFVVTNSMEQNTLLVKLIVA